MGKQQSDREITVAVLGGGTVGAEVVRLLAENAGDMAARAGAPLRVTGVAVRDASRPRTGIDPGLLVDDALGLVGGGADIVVELIGGIELPYELVRRALTNGSNVVTANKALIAEHGAELHALAEAHGVDLYYEAAVAGAIPLLHPLGNNLSGDRITRVLGIVNGTTNYILSRMDEEGAAYEDVLAQAQQLGYAEADPTADVGGHDAAAKAAILAGLAFHAQFTAADVHTEGITEVTAADIAAARDMGFVIKLLAIAELVDEEGVCIRVHPTMVPRTHPLANVRGAFNAVFVEAEAAGEVMFYGQGAGGVPTASAVLGDVVTVARHVVTGSRGPVRSTYSALPALSISRARSGHYVSLDVDDRPGVLAAVSSVFADHGVSISGVRQEGEHDGAALVVRTHTATDEAMSATLESLQALDVVRSVVGAMRVEGVR